MKPQLNNFWLSVQNEGAAFKNKALTIVKEVTSLPIPSNLYGCENLKKDVKKRLEEIKGERMLITNKFDTAKRFLMQFEKAIEDHIVKIDNKIKELKANELKRIREQEAAREALKIQQKQAFDAIMEKAPYWVKIAKEMKITIDEIPRWVSEQADIYMERVFKLKSLNEDLKNKYKEYVTELTINEQSTAKADEVKDVAALVLSATDTDELQKNVNIKEVFELDMPDSYSTALSIMKAFVSLGSRADAKLRVKNYFNLTISQMATAVMAVMNEDSNVIFPELIVKKSIK